MKKKKHNSYEFFNKPEIIKFYKKNYHNKNFKEVYPANLKRLDIAVNLLKKYKPKEIVDAGCGECYPMIRILKNKFKIFGYDKSKNMLEAGKKNLKRAGYNTNLINIGDFESPNHKKVDCILALASFYYTKNIKKILKKQVKFLKPKGRIIFSLRNELFDISTFNDYSVNFFSSLYKLNKKLPYEKKYMSKYFKSFEKKINKQNIDKNNVQNLRHNPLTINKEILNPVGLKLNGIYFYHYHHMPPKLEIFDRENFFKNSWRIEDPLSWKGYFLASCFVADVQLI